MLRGTQIVLGIVSSLVGGVRHARVGQRLGAGGSGREMGGKKDSSSVLHAAKQSEVPGFTSPATTSDGSPWDGIEVEGFEFGEPVSVPALSFFNLYVCSLRRGSGH